LDWKCVCGNTYVAEGKTALLPMYRLRPQEIVLLDTGLAHGDRAELDKFLEKNGLRVAGIICTHAHYDHTGNARYFQQKYHCPVAMPALEAFIAASPEALRANYQGFSYGDCRAFFQKEWVKCDEIIPQSADFFSFCGVSFGIIPLAGHTVGQIGIVTPDQIAYLADALIDAETLGGFKLPTMMDVERNMKSISALQPLSCNAYILAHKAVVTELAPVIRANLDHILSTKNALLSCLADGMLLSEWQVAFCKIKEIHAKKPFAIGVLRRNFHDFTDYLVDCGAVERRSENGVTRYFHCA
jgi:hydroxyacylglutathione hydrolase